MAPCSSENLIQLLLVIIKQSSVYQWVYLEPQGSKPVDLQINQLQQISTARIDSDFSNTISEDSHSNNTAMSGLQKLAQGAAETHLLSCFRRVVQVVQVKWGHVQEPGELCTGGA
jgi:hypothetical protein